MASPSTIIHKLTKIIFSCNFLILNRSQTLVNRHDDMTQITDLAGNYWLAANMFETAVTVMVFTMLYSAILVLVNLFREKAVNID